MRGFASGFGFPKVRGQLAIDTDLVNVELLQPQPTPEATPPQPDLPVTSQMYTGLAVRQNDRWIAVAPELGTVAEGGSADEALLNLNAAIQDVLEIANAEQLPSGQKMSLAELGDLILEHRRQSSAPVTMRSLLVRT